MDAENDDIWKLIARKLAGEESPDDATRFDELIRQNCEIEFYLGLLESCWHSTAFEQRATADQVVQRLQQDIWLIQPN